MCALNGKYNSFMRRNPESESLINAGVTSRSLASRKVVYREVCTEMRSIREYLKKNNNTYEQLSGTAKVCTEEHELDKRHARVDEIAQLIEVPNDLALACRSGRSKQKGICLTGGGLHNHVLVKWRSQQRP